MRPPRKIQCPCCNYFVTVPTTEKRKNRGRSYYHNNRTAILVRNKLGVSIGEARKRIERGEMDAFLKNIARRRSKYSGGG